MFPIGSAVPHDTASLRAALLQGIAPIGVGPEGIRLDGDFPRFDVVVVNLTGARFDHSLEVSRPGGERQSLCFARAVEITGDPVLVKDIPITLALSAQDVVLASADAADGSGKVLTLDRVNDGKLDLSAKCGDLEKALLAAGEAAARSKGAEVKSVELTLQNETPRALAVRAVVTAKAMFFTTTVTISGLVELDEQLNARLRDLHCEGDGMVGKMAAGALRPQFEKLQQRVIPLGQAVAGFAVTDVTLTGGDALRIRASFRSVA
jgi:hypothetical protein